MENFFRSKRFKILITVIAVLFGIMLYGASSDGIASMPEKLFSYLTWPFQQISSAATGATTGFFDKYLNVDQTIAERDALQQEVNDLRQPDHRQHRTGTGKRIPAHHAGHRRGARGLHLPQRQHHRLGPEFYLYHQQRRKPRRGGERRHHHRRRFGGVVSKVSSTTATVKTLYSTAIDVGAKELNSGKIGVVTGDLNLAEDGYCLMRYLESEVSIGDTIVTSGSGGILPSGLAIGRVVDVQLERNSPTYYATIEPFNDIEELTQVFVITSFAGQDQG